MYLLVGDNLNMMDLLNEACELGRIEGYKMKTFGKIPYYCFKCSG